MVFFEASTNVFSNSRSPKFFAKAEIETEASEPEVLVNTIYFMTMSASKHSLSFMLIPVKLSTHTLKLHHAQHQKTGFPTKKVPRKILVFRCLPHEKIQDAF